MNFGIQSTPVSNFMYHVNEWDYALLLAHPVIVNVNEKRDNDSEALSTPISVV